MLKAILVLFVCLSCYFIYNFTQDDSLFYLNIGDGLAEDVTNGYGFKVKNYLINKDKLEGYNDSFTNADYRITDVLRLIKYHEKIVINKDEITINELMKKADIITLSVGMNEIYYKIMLNNNNIYTYMDAMINDMNELLKEIDRYSHKKVIVLGLYSIDNEFNDIFTYVNYGFEKVCTRHGFDFINLNSILSKNDFNNGEIHPNNEGYEKIYQIIVDKIKNY